jgi:seryl-tRNA(Sec) selenium transferase
MNTKIIVGVVAALALVFVFSGKSEKQKQDKQAQREAAMVNGMLQNLADVHAAENQINVQRQAEQAQRMKLREDIRAGMPTPRVGSTEWLRQNDDGR